MTVHCVLIACLHKSTPHHSVKNITILNKHTPTIEYFLTQFLERRPPAEPNSKHHAIYGCLLNPASIRAVRRSESVIHSGFLTTEVAGDGKTGCDDWHP